MSRLKASSPFKSEGLGQYFKRVCCLWNWPKILYFRRGAIRQQALHDTVEAGIIGIAIVFFIYAALLQTAWTHSGNYAFCIRVYYASSVWLDAGCRRLVQALILGVGMAVDANIITYERIKEELKLGKSVRSAFRSGNRRSIDYNDHRSGRALYFGTSSVKRVCDDADSVTPDKFYYSCLPFDILALPSWKADGLTGKKGWFGVKKNILWTFKNGWKYWTAYGIPEMGFHEQAKIFLYFKR